MPQAMDSRNFPRLQAGKTHTCQPRMSMHESATDGLYELENLNRYFATL